MDRDGGFVRDDLAVLFGAKVDVGFVRIAIALILDAAGVLFCLISGALSVRSASGLELRKIGAVVAIEIIGAEQRLRQRIGARGARFRRVSIEVACPIDIHFRLAREQVAVLTQQIAGVFVAGENPAGVPGGEGRIVGVGILVERSGIIEEKNLL